ncbi:Ig-like domain-containing domain [uncultured Muribaculum sp.]|uniref:Ig-like domain-containing domain n=1 Tax=uncultured Muribaculum sp. TaxID=1918613 RepID=UPI0026DEB318|nr:Ig-like domain-containing domain [uncultured Muribaculum sp.]
MNFNYNNGNGLRLFVAVAVSALLAACASIGRPSGGEYDYTPPVFLRSTPAIGQRNVNESRIELFFDENVQVKDAMTKVVVSPAQINIPQITANGKKLTVSLRDTLIPNTTYTIDFSDAVSDLNEGNELDGLAVSFSTGDTVDSLQISGMVFEARNLEPAQGMVVGVYSNLDDSAVRTLQLERIAKTNQKGQFTIRGLKPGKYRIYAINDLNRDYHWDRSEDVAFYDVLVSPSVSGAVESDTLKAVNGEDSVVSREVAHYLPDDILLTWFNEGYKAQYIDKYERAGRRRIDITMAAPADSLPVLTLVGGPRNGAADKEWAVLSRSATADTLQYFITDSLVLAQDTLLVSVRNLRTDTLNTLSWFNDTLRFVYKAPKVDKKQVEREIKAERERLRKLGADTLDTIILPPKIDFLSLRFNVGSTQDVHKPVFFETEQPLGSIDTAGVHFEVQRDTLWDPLPAPAISLADSIYLKRYRVDYKWNPGARYRLKIDSAAVKGMYGEWNKAVLQDFKVRELSDYSTLYFSISGLPDSVAAVVELLDSKDNVKDTASVVSGSAEFDFILPGTYYARLFIDRNRNGKYDTGILDSIQPEDVYYYPKKIVLKKNWDVEQTWNVNELPVDQQKPKELVKNKVKDKKRRRNPDGSFVRDENDGSGNSDEEDEEFIDRFGGSNNFFGPGNSNGTRNIGNSNNYNMR